mmetsp:Transcript_40585/g.80194  ORF Transcript_40585/g.80194 Transcript_40585/m.80194 type:complete len:221 (-) Transcript_40585:38-700(-)
MANGAPPIFSGSPLEVPTANPGKVDVQAAGGLTMNLVADEQVSTLGLAFYQLPPSAARVKRIQQGSWAEREHVMPEDEVISLNGVRVADMDEAIFTKTMKERPLEIIVVRPSAEQDPCGVATPPVASRGHPVKVALPADGKLGTDVDTNKLPTFGGARPPGTVALPPRGTNSEQNNLPTGGGGTFTTGLANAVKEMVCCGVANRGSASGNSQRRNTLLIA